MQFSMETCVRQGGWVLPLGGEPLPPRAVGPGLPGGRLVVSGPIVGYQKLKNEGIQYCIQSCVRARLPPSHPGNRPGPPLVDTGVTAVSAVDIERYRT
jgi:hypothetical protein